MEKIYTQDEIKKIETDFQKVLNTPEGQRTMEAIKQKALEKAANLANNPPSQPSSQG